MKKYFYDLHIHSCLSPCGDDDATPCSIAGIGKLNGLDIMALTDHNTAKNCPAFFKAAKAYGIIAVAGMELTTAEDIHMVCLFRTLNDALACDEALSEKRILMPNRPEIFGRQLIMDEDDNIIAEEENILSFATNLSFDEVPEFIKGFNGVCYPAHIDRPSNSVIAVLGAFPPNHSFPCAEMHGREKVTDYAVMASLKTEKMVFSSDAHQLLDIKEAVDYIELPDDDQNAVENLFKALGF